MSVLINACIRHSTLLISFLVDLEGRVKELELKDVVQNDPMDVGDTFTNPPYDAQPHYGTTDDALNPAPSPSNLSLPSVGTTAHVTSPAPVLGSPDTIQGQEGTQYVNTNSPLNTFNPLSSGTVTELCAVWFQSYHQWFPILHQPSLLEALQLSPSIQSCSRYLVLKSIVAVTLHHCQSSPTTIEERMKWSESLRDSTIIEAMGDLSLQSLQSLLILSIADYGIGEMARFWNLIALCKRFVFPSI